MLRFLFYFLAFAVCFLYLAEAGTPKNKMKYPAKIFYPPWYARGIGQLDGRIWRGYEWGHGYPPTFGRFYSGGGLIGDSAGGGGDEDAN